MLSVLIFAKQGDSADVALAFIFLAATVVISLIAAAIRGPASYNLIVSKNGLPYCPRCNRQVSYRRDYCRACGYTFKTYRSTRARGPTPHQDEAFKRAMRRLAVQVGQAVSGLLVWWTAWRGARSEARDAFYRSRDIEPGPLAWYRVLSDWQQAIVLGLAIAAPVVGLILLIAVR